ncbi:MAG: ferritin family protein [Proteobacteria bacterium]|nr:ferritin family protein [Pseudomonadota bacterium]
MAENSSRILMELESARKTEMAGYYFYTVAAEMVEDSKGRKVFESLAKDELQHMTVVATIVDSVSGGLGWITYDEALAKSEGTEVEPLPIFKEENEMIDRLNENQTDLNAIQIGIEAEEDAIRFYSDLLKDAATPVEKVVLTTLLEMEKSHLKLLRWEGESIANEGFWCGNMEFSVEQERD